MFISFSTEPRTVGKLVEERGIEPRSTPCKSAVIPLYYSPQSFLNYFDLFITFSFLTDSSVFFFLPKMLSQLSLPCFDNVLDCMASPVISFLLTIHTPLDLERVVGFEPTASTLARLRSTK